MIGDPYVTRVREFHKAFLLPAPAGIDLAPSPELLNLRSDLMSEELLEFEIAAGLLGQSRYDPVDVADALGDLLYVVFGTAVALGIPINDVFREIHRSNMTKLPVTYRDDGKVLKGPNYEPPRLNEIVLLGRAPGGTK